MHWKIHFIVLVLLTVLMGCSSQRNPASTEPITSELIAGKAYNFLGFDQDERVSLLGKLYFENVGDVSISGSWEMNAWQDSIFFAPIIGGGEFTGEFIPFNSIRLNLSPQSAIEEDNTSFRITGLSEGKLIGNWLWVKAGNVINQGRIEAIEAIE